MARNYTQRLEKLQKRRSDEILQKAFLTESFRSPSYGESTKYTLESMMPIDRQYTLNTYKASENIQNNLTQGLIKKGIQVSYRHQGSVVTNTHIKLHSDIDVLVIHERFYSLQPPLVPTIPYNGDPLADMKELRNECEEILNSIYKQVDDTGSKAIKVFPTNPKRKVDVVPANWLDTKEYAQTKNEDYRAIHLYDKDSHTREPDYSFLHIARLKHKDSLTNGNFASLVRLLKTLKVDAEYEINLSSFEICGIVYHMNNNDLILNQGYQLLLLPKCSNHLSRLITDDDYRKSLLSPNEKEYLFGENASKKVELKKLKLELDEVIDDLSIELAKGYNTIQTQINYK